MNLFLSVLLYTLKSLTGVVRTLTSRRTGHRLMSGWFHIHTHTSWDEREAQRACTRPAATKEGYIPGARAWKADVAR